LHCLHYLHGHGVWRWMGCGGMECSLRNMFCYIILISLDGVVKRVLGVKKAGRQADGELGASNMAEALRAKCIVTYGSMA
jgi:hypothetical protein